ncbi:MAG TPA: hypothetical protein VH210_14920 [Gaiellaceae bacterium]|nr:hypothetical protein [Gaiellaceae bacterium]
MGAFVLARLDPLYTQCLELDELRVLKSGHCRRHLLDDVCNPLSGEASVCMAMHTHRLKLERDSKPRKVALKDHLVTLHRRHDGIVFEICPRISQ